MERPQPRQLIPNFALTGTDGREFRSAAYKGLSNLVLVFPAGNGRALLSELAARKTEFEEENTKVVLIVSERFQRKDEAPFFPVLVDQAGEVIRKYGAEAGPAVYITDQYGEIYSAYRSDEGVGLPDADEILASLRHINAACPE